MNTKTLQTLKQCFEQNELTFELLLKHRTFSCDEEKECLEKSIEVNKTSAFIIGQEIEMKRLNITV